MDSASTVSTPPAPIPRKRVPNGGENRNTYCHINDELWALWVMPRRTRGHAKGFPSTGVPTGLNGSEHKSEDLGGEGGPEPVALYVCFHVSVCVRGDMHLKTPSTWDTSLKSVLQKRGVGRACWEGGA